MACSGSEKQAIEKAFERAADQLNNDKDRFVSDTPSYTNNELGHYLMGDTKYFDQLNYLGEQAIDKCGFTESQLYDKYVDPEVQMAVYEAAGKTVREVPFFGDVISALIVGGIMIGAVYGMTKLRGSFGNLFYR